MTVAGYYSIFICTKNSIVFVYIYYKPSKKSHSFPWIKLVSYCTDNHNDDCDASSGKIDVQHFGALGFFDGANQNY